MRFYDLNPRGAAAMPVESVTITVELPRPEAAALARLVKRMSFDDVMKLAAGRHPEGEARPLRSGDTRRAESALRPGTGKISRHGCTNGKVARLVLT